VEVLARIRFTTPCLGNVRGEKLDRMLRNSEGRVLLLQSWWRAGFAYAAQALCKHQGEIGQLQAAPEISGEVKIHRRFYGPQEFKEHEAFPAGSEIEVRFCLPPKLGLEDFKELLAVAGEYVGISPYGYKQDYGRYVVVDASPYRRPKGGESEDRPAGQPDHGESRLSSGAGAGAHVHAPHPERL
jgi:hypothetical protein